MQESVENTNIKIKNYSSEDRSAIPTDILELNALKGILYLVVSKKKIPSMPQKCFEPMETLWRYIA